MVNINRSADRAWDRMPLCRNYALALFSDLCVNVRHQGAVGRWRFNWAMGMLADGQHDLLGLWHGPAADGTNWQLIADDLNVRGVEKIQLVAFMASTGGESGMRDRSPSLMVWPSVDRFLDLRGRVSVGHFPTHTPEVEADRHLRETPGDCTAEPNAVNSPRPAKRWGVIRNELDPLRALAPRFPSFVRSAESDVRHLSHLLSRAANRKGCFPCLPSASSFFREMLTRAERRLDWPPLGPVTVVGRRAACVIDPGIPGSAR